MALSPMQILLEGKRDEGYTRALSDKLRYRKDMGEFLQLAGNKDISEFGGSLRADVLGQQKQKEKQDQRAMTQGYYDDATEGRKSALSETIRHNKEVERIAELRAVEASRKSRFKMPTVSAQKKTDDAIESYEGIRRTIRGYDPKYATNTAGAMFKEGSITNFLGPKMGNQGMLDQSRWWADYDLLYTLGRRNKLFGSALTDSEIKAWQGANISPNSTDDAIQRGLATLMEIADRKFKQQFTNDVSMYDQDWVMGMYGPYMGGEDEGDEEVPKGGPGAEQQEAVPTDVPATGAWSDMQR